jgi:hypothetical protein
MKKQKSGLFVAAVLSVAAASFAFYVSPYTVAIVPKVTPTATPLPTPKPTPRKKQKGQAMPATNYLVGATVIDSVDNSSDANMHDGDTGTTGVLGGSIRFDLGAPVAFSEVAVDVSSLADDVDVNISGSNSSDMSGAVSLAVLHLLVSNGATRYGAVPSDSGTFRYVEFNGPGLSDGLNVKELEANGPDSGTGSGHMIGAILRRYALGR